MSILFLMFIAGIVSAVVTAFLARSIATVFVAENVAPYVGFAFALGAIGTREISSSLTSTQISTGLGGLLGLVLVWWLFFKREKAFG